MTDLFVGQPMALPRSPKYIMYDYWREVKATVISDLLVFREFDDCSVCRECLHTVEGMGLVVELGEGLGEGLL